MLRLLAFFFISFTSLWLPALSQAQLPDTRAMVVVDASGSMRGKIQGVKKIELLKESVRDLAFQWPEDREVGMLIFGHRRLKDCSDIEVLATPDQGLSMQDLADRLSSVKSIGNTPLTAALEQAALALPNDGQQSSIIVLSDGRETCRRDPCALAMALKAQNVGLTAYVIGLDIDDKGERDQLRCIARETGGLYWDAEEQEDFETAFNEASDTIAAGGPQARRIDTQALAYSCRGESVRLTAGYYSFADVIEPILRGTKVTSDPRANAQKAALGAPDYSGASRADGSFYSLGCKAQIEIQFTDNVLVEGPGPELCVAEVGSDLEALEVSIEEGQTWRSVGMIDGLSGTFDLAGHIPRGSQVSRLRLTDTSDCLGDYPGADIDSIIGLNGYAVQRSSPQN